MAGKTPARGKGGRFVKGRKKPARKRRPPPKKKGPRKRKGAALTPVIVRANPPKKRPAKKRKRRRNPPMPAWLGAAGAAAAVAAGVALVKAYVPIEALQRPMVSALLGPAVALVASAMLMRKAKTRPISYALMGAGVYSLASYASAYTMAKMQEAKETGRARSNPPRLRYRRSRETLGVPADQKPRLAAGVTSLPVADMDRAAGAYSM